MARWRAAAIINSSTPIKLECGMDRKKIKPLQFFFLIFLCGWNSGTAARVKNGQNASGADIMLFCSSFTINNIGKDWESCGEHAISRCQLFSRGRNRYLSTARSAWQPSKDGFTTPRARPPFDDDCRTATVSRDTLNFSAKRCLVMNIRLFQ
jgi:hypothetical protein